MKDRDLILLAALGIGAFLLYKSGVLDKLFEPFAGGGGGSGGVGGETIEETPVQIAPLGNGSPTVSAWTGTGFGVPGQPSLDFAVRTLYQATIPEAPREVRLAATAIRAGAPPRMVAKIKAGHHVLDGGKY